MFLHTNLREEVDDGLQDVVEQDGEGQRDEDVAESIEHDA